MRTRVVETVYPRLRHRLDTFDRTDVVRLAKVVPGVDLDKVDHAPVCDERFPPLGQQPVVAAVDEVLVVCLRAVMLERVYVLGRSLCTKDCVGLTVKNQGDTAAMTVRPPVRFWRCRLSESKFAFSISFRGVDGFNWIGQPPFHYNRKISTNHG